MASRSEGNPFYVEELINYVARQSLDMTDASALGSVELPGSLQTLVLSRIDAAPEEPRRTMKVAGVVGRSFEAPALPGAYEELGTLATVRRHLEALRTLDLVALDREADEAWMFVHGMTQEVAYESLPFAMRAILHGRIGDYLERTEPDLERSVYLLEHHYWRSDREDKKREYLWKAADAAAGAYANNAAIVYLERLVPAARGQRPGAGPPQPRQGIRAGWQLGTRSGGRRRGAGAGHRDRRPARPGGRLGRARRGGAQAGPL